MRPLSLNTLILEADACLFEGPRWPVRRPRTGEAVGISAFLLRAYMQAAGEEGARASAAAQLATGTSPAMQALELSDPRLITLTLGGPGVYAGCAQLDLRGPPPPWVGCPSAVELRRFQIDRTKHGDSLAAELLQRVGEAARGRGARALWLEAWAGLGEVGDFFVRQGFAPCADQALGDLPESAWRLCLNL